MKAPIGSGGNGAARIKSLRVEVLQVTLPVPVSLATRKVTTRDYLFVELTDDSGHSGFGFSYAGYEAGELAGSAVQYLFAPTLVGMKLEAPAIVARRIATLATGHGLQGVVARALSAVDIALWDLTGQQRECPLAEMLSGRSSQPPETYVGAGYYGPNTDNELLMEELRALVQDGHRCIKVKVGRDGVIAERKRAVDARSAAGSTTHLTFDANGAFGDAITAERYLQAYADADPEYVEDPLPVQALREYPELARRSPVALTCGEYLTNRSEWSFMLRSGSTNLIQIDATACGGISEMVRIAHAADLFGIRFDTHWFPELHQQIAGCFPNLHRVETFRNDDIIPFGKLVQRGRLWGHGLTFSDHAQSVAKTTFLGVIE